MALSSKLATTFYAAAAPVRTSNAFPVVCI